MPSALQLIERVVIDKLLRDPTPLSGFDKMGQFLCALSALFLVTGLIFLVYGAHSWLSIHYSGEIAASITGIISLLLSVIIAGIFFAGLHYRQARIRKFQKNIADKIKSSLSTLEDELGDPIRENPKTALIIASFLGFLVEDQFFE